MRRAPRPASRRSPRSSWSRVLVGFLVSRPVAQGARPGRLAAARHRSARASPRRPSGTPPSRSRRCGAASSCCRSSRRGARRATTEAPEPRDLRVARARPTTPATRARRRLQRRRRGRRVVRPPATASRSPCSTDPQRAARERLRASPRRRSPIVLDRSGQRRGGPPGRRSPPTSWSRSRRRALQGRGVSGRARGSQPVCLAVVLGAALLVGSGVLSAPAPGRGARIAALERLVAAPAARGPVGRPVQRARVDRGAQPDRRRGRRGLERRARSSTRIEAHYGTQILLEPPAGGLDTVLWAAPVALAVGAAVVARDGGRRGGGGGRERRTPSRSATRSSCSRARSTTRGPSTPAASSTTRGSPRSSGATARGSPTARVARSPRSPTRGRLRAARRAAARATRGADRAGSSGWPRRASRSSSAWSSSPRRTRSPRAARPPAPTTRPARSRSCSIEAEVLVQRAPPPARADRLRRGAAARAERTPRRSSRAAGCATSSAGSARHDRAQVALGAAQLARAVRLAPRRRRRAPVLGHRPLPARPRRPRGARAAHPRGLAARERAGRSGSPRRSLRTLRHAVLSDRSAQRAQLAEHLRERREERVDVRRRSSTTRRSRAASGPRRRPSRRAPRSARATPRSTPSPSGRSRRSDRGRGARARPRRPRRRSSARAAPGRRRRVVADAPDAVERRPSPAPARAISACRGGRLGRQPRAAVVGEHRRRGAEPEDARRRSRARRAGRAPGRRRRGAARGAAPCARRARRRRAARRAPSAHRVV